MKTARLAAAAFAALLLAPIPSSFAADPPAAPMMSSTPNTLTDAERQAGWKLLFDGKTLNGWSNFKKDAIRPGWQVVDGALTLTVTALSLMA